MKAIRCASYLADGIEVGEPAAQVDCGCMP